MLKDLNRFADWRDQYRMDIHAVAVAVTETYARRVLKLKRSEPLVFRGLVLTCIGSKRWRQEQRWEWTRWDT